MQQAPSLARRAVHPCVGGLIVLILGSAATPVLFAQTVTDEALSAIERGDLVKADSILVDASRDRELLDDERFLWGITRYLQASERFSQAMYAHGGIGGRTIVLPLPAAVGDPNPRPQRMSYPMMRSILEQLRSDLDEVIEIWGAIDNPDWKLPINAFEIHLDLDGDGSLENEESLAAVVARSLGRVGIDPIEAQEIAFDQADVHWFRGQCLLVSAICDFMLAHDWQDSWNHFAPLTFGSTDSPFEPFIDENNSATLGNGLAFIHLLQWDVIEPERMPRCRDKLHSMMVELRRCITAIQEETDNDREWLPSPTQVSVVPVLRTTTKGLETIDDFLGSCERVLSGESHLPLLRSVAEQFMNDEFEDQYGVNVYRYFEEPCQFDLALMLQGSRVIEYLEEGSIESNFWIDLVNLLMSQELAGFVFG